jgi:hypothetical protein
MVQEGCVIIQEGFQWWGEPFDAQVRTVGEKTAQEVEVLVLPALRVAGLIVPAPSLISAIPFKAFGL